MNRINCIGFALNKGDNQLRLIQFQPNEGDREDARIISVSLTRPNLIETLLNQIPGETKHWAIREMFSNILDLAFNMAPIQNNNGGFNNQKMAIMITDCTINLGTNFDELKNELVHEFKKRGVVLYVVATETPVYNIWDFYRTLARDTGGEYMLLQNASAILQAIILSAMYEGYTLRQATQRVHPPNVAAVPNNLDETNEENQTTDGVGELDFDHGLI